MAPRNRPLPRRSPVLPRKPNGAAGGPLPMAVEIAGGDEPTPVFSGLAAQQRSARVSAAARMTLGKRKAEPDPDPEPEPELSLEDALDVAEREEEAAALDVKNPPTPAPATNPLHIRPVTVADVDNLWDWVRQDSDRGNAFLGFEAKSSLDVHQFMRTISERASLGLAAIHAIDLQGQHIGFGVLFPIVEEKKVALTHFYLNQQFRGYLPQLLPSLMHFADATRPDLRLVIMSDRPEWARLLVPLGFRQQIVLIRD